MRTGNFILMIDPNNKLGHFYLEYLISIDLKPKIILVIDKNSKQKFRLFLRHIKSLFIPERRVEIKDLKALTNQLNSQFKVKIKTKYNYSDYADSVVYVNAGLEGPNSRNVIDFITTCDASFVIFSGGGILKKKILSIDGKRFLHTHPGIVPHVRGADCFFWSVLKRGRPGYSCFYMTPGIDEGDILHTEEYDLSKLKFNEGVSTDYNYKAILSSVDLHFRAQCLCSFLENNPHFLVDTESVQTKKQSPDEGRMYFFMHKALLDFSMRKVIALSDKQGKVS